MVNKKKNYDGVDVLEYSDNLDKQLEEFDKFIDFLKEKYPKIKEEFFEWKERGEK